MGATSFWKSLAKGGESLRRGVANATASRGVTGGVPLLNEVTGQEQSVQLDGELHTPQSQLFGKAASWAKRAAAATSEVAVAAAAKVRCLAGPAGPGGRPHHGGAGARARRMAKRAAVRAEAITVAVQRNEKACVKVDALKWENATLRKKVARQAAALRVALSQAARRQMGRSRGRTVVVSVKEDDTSLHLEIGRLKSALSAQKISTIRLEMEVEQAKRKVEQARTHEQFALKCAAAQAERAASEVALRSGANRTPAETKALEFLSRVVRDELFRDKQARALGATSKAEKDTLQMLSEWLRESGRPVPKHFGGRDYPHVPTTRCPEPAQPKEEPIPPSSVSPVKLPPAPVVESKSSRAPLTRLPPPPVEDAQCRRVVSGPDTQLAPKLVKDTVGREVASTGARKVPKEAVLVETKAASSSQCVEAVAKPSQGDDDASSSTVRKKKKKKKDLFTACTGEAIRPDKRRPSERVSALDELRQWGEPHPRDPTWVQNIHCAQAGITRRDQLHQYTR